jgi:hypothetical protein
MPVDWDSLVIAPCLAVFGSPVTYTPVGGNAITITGIFDNEYFDQNALGAGLIEQVGMPGNITASRPVLGIRLAEFPAGIAPLQGDTLALTETGVTYTVMEVRPDSHGSAKLLLNEAS